MAGLAGCAPSGDAVETEKVTGAKLTVLIGSSGDAETAAVTAAADAWATAHKSTVKVVAATT